MNFYTPDNPPKRGKALLIWKALHKGGFTLRDLHYNPNLWGRGSAKGWGTWACETADRRLYWTGADPSGVYLETMTAPYSKVYLKEE